MHFWDTVLLFYASAVGKPTCNNSSLYLFVSGMLPAKRKEVGTVNWWLCCVSQITLGGGGAPSGIILCTWYFMQDVRFPVLMLQQKWWKLLPPALPPAQDSPLPFTRPFLRCCNPRERCSRGRTVRHPPLKSPPF